MLILSRRVGETLVIGQNIHVTVSEIRGNQVRLAIAAPPDIQVDRQEIRELKDAQRAKAGGA